MKRDILFLLLIGGIIRLYLMLSDFGELIRRRIEFATPLNSYKRVQEGIYLLQHGVDPYMGEMVHEIPLLLIILEKLFKLTMQRVCFVYVAIDMSTALVLFQLGKEFVYKKLDMQKKIGKFAPNTHELQMQPSDVEFISRCVLFIYLFNPLSILSCVGLTSTTITNLLISLTLYTLSKNWLLPCLVFSSLETMRSLYPAVLLAPIIIVFGKRSYFRSFIVVASFTGFCLGISWLNFLITQNWNFLDGTLGFIFRYHDLQPNVGLFWYFFTEMFEHFRTMFLVTFQMNATVLYLVPLSLKLRKNPILLATVLLALTTIFRSYPSLGDVSFYLALLPLWRRCWKFMAHNFVVLGLFLVTLLMMPALWYLWIYAGSANANFYFGTTLAFSTGQIFLVTDILFAYVKREFCLQKGQRIYVNGKEARIILE